MIRRAVLRRAMQPAGGGLAEELWGLVSSPGWWIAGLCAQTDPELFFPEKGGSVREAQQVCARCPVRAQCLEHALAHGERFGVWGGLSERERHRLTRTTSRPPVPAAGLALGEVDEVVVDRLVSGQSVTGASRVEVAEAAIGLRHAGQGTRRIAAQLGVHPRQVHRWLARHEQCPRCPDRTAA